MLEGTLESRLKGWAGLGQRRAFINEASAPSFHRKSFLDRLSDAERRDAQKRNAMQSSAQALDDLLFESDEESFDDSKNPNGALLPTIEEVEKVARLFWDKPAVERQKRHDWLSMTDAEVDCAQNLESQELDRTTFMKLLALVQKPEHSLKSEARPRETPSSSVEMALPTK